MKITPSASSVKPGDTVTLNAVPQQYNPARKTYTDVTGKTYTVSWTVTEGSDVVTLNSRTGLLRDADRQVRRHRDDHGRDHH